MSRGRRAEGACVSSARGCRGTMAAPRGEVGGRRDGGARGGRWRTSVTTCPRPRGSGARRRRRAGGVCLEPLCGVSRRGRLLGRRGAVSLLPRLSCSSRTPLRAVWLPETAPAPTSLQWVGTKFRGPGCGGPGEGPERRSGAGSASPRDWQDCALSRPGPSRLRSLLRLLPYGCSEA